MNGYALIHRSLIGNPQFRGKDDEYSAVWLILHACWQDTTVRINRKPMGLKRGELCYATSYLAQAWECSKTTAHARLQHFKKHGFIRTQERTGELVIVICNYEQYQGNTNDDRTEDGTQPRTQDGTTPERAPNAPRTNKNTLNPSNTLNSSKDGAEKVSRETMEGSFAKFWEIYPTGRKTAKPKAKEKFFALVRGGVDAQAIIDGAKRYADAGYADSKYVAGPLVWLNQGRWTDEDIPTPGDKQRPTVDRATKRRAGIFAALGRELADEADTVGGIGGAADLDGDGEGEVAGFDADTGIDGDTGPGESVRRSDGQAIRMGGIDGATAERARGNGPLPRGISGHSSGPFDVGDRSNGGHAPVPQFTEAAGHSAARFGRNDAPQIDAEHGAGEPESDPFALPDFLRRKAS